MSLTLGVGRARKIQSGELYHPTYSFSFKLLPVTISGSVFSHNFTESNSVLFLKKYQRQREREKFSH
jgi:hypothetical protein